MLAGVKRNFRARGVGGGDGRREAREAEERREIAWVWVEDVTRGVSSVRAMRIESRGRLRRDAVESADERATGCKVKRTLLAKKRPAFKRS